MTYTIAKAIGINLYWIKNFVTFHLGRKTNRNHITIAAMLTIEKIEEGIIFYFLND